jgi:putrescine aminotransferase
VPELISLDAAARLSSKQVHDLYRQYASRSQVELMTSFGFGRELVDSAEGVWIRLRDGRRVLDSPFLAALSHNVASLRGK